MKNGSRSSTTGKTEVQKVGDKTLREWESSWRSVGYLDSIDLSPYSSYVGLYRAELGGIFVYIGRAVEYSNGGIRKRLSDYMRDSDCARKHTSGQLMHANASDLNISILLVGSDEESAVPPENCSVTSSACALLNGIKC